MRETDPIKSLRSVRQFSEREISDDVLLDILDTGRWTGSAKNSQPWNFIVVKNRQSLAALSNCGRYAGHLESAPLAIALVMDGEDASALMDEGRLMQNVMLGAWAHGVGSCIASIYPADNERRARELLGIPPERHLRTMLSIGYPAGPQALRLPENAPIPRGRRPMAEVVSWERWGATG